LFWDAAGKGWTIVTVDGFPLGWGKLVQGQLKNHYPKGLRWV
jgi:NOL1/NOP2/fmu family ribosome biogenesis protein